jgi:hypothetical protein
VRISEWRSIQRHYQVDSSNRRISSLARHGTEILPTGPYGRAGSAPGPLAAASPQADPQPDYVHAREALYAGSAASGLTPGDPARHRYCRPGPGGFPSPPLRVLFGVNGLGVLRTEYASRLAGLEEWDHLSRLAHGSPAVSPSGA